MGLYRPGPQKTLRKLGRRVSRATIQQLLRIRRLSARTDAMIRWAAINGLVRRLTRGKPATRRPAWAFEDLKEW